MHICNRIELLCDSPALPCDFVPHPSRLVTCYCSAITEANAPVDLFLTRGFCLGVKQTNESSNIRSKIAKENERILIFMLELRSVCHASSIFEYILQAWKPGENIRSSPFVRTWIRSSPKFNARFTLSPLILFPLSL